MYGEPSYRLRELLGLLSPRNIDLPPSMGAAVELWQRIRDTAPAREATPTTLRDAILSEASPAERDAALLAELGAQRTSVAWTQAEQVAAGNALDELTLHADEVHQQLQALAAPIIEKLQTIAGMPDRDLTTLIRNGNTESAALAADADLFALELKTLFDIRDRFLIPGGFQQLKVGHIDCSRWANAPEFHCERGTTIADQFVNGIKASGELWFPSADEAINRAETYWATYAEQQAQHRHELFGVGSSTTSWES